MAALPINGVSIYGIKRVLNRYVKCNQSWLWRGYSTYFIEIWFESTKSYDDAALQAIKFYKKLQDAL